MYKRYFEESKSVFALFTDRLGGISPKPFDSLNMAFTTGDERKNVEKNRNRIFNRFKFSMSSVAYADQCHSDNISVVDMPKIYTQSDALITNYKNLPLIIQVADCACVYLYDEKNKAIGLVHSGWRGSKKNIVLKTIKKMQTVFSTEVHRLKAIVSPCISKEYFEVGEDVYAQFHMKYFVAKGEGKWLFDMTQYLCDELKSAGVNEVKVDSQCSYKNKAKYFSYRRDGKKSGRMIGFFYLK